MGAFAMEPQYITWPPFLPAAATPLCSRFVEKDCIFDSTIRVEVDGSMAMRVWLRSEFRNARSAEIKHLPISMLFDGQRQTQFIQSVCDTFDDLLAKVDYQLAAYCASDLWC